MTLDPIHAFYCRKEYLTLAEYCKAKSGGICARCGKAFDVSELRPHHKVELTIENIDDPNITLNPDNIEVLCHNCHNAIHNRFGNAVSTKHVYLVYGSPLAGKTTYVETVATRNDIVVNLDKIHKAICVCGMRDKPDATKRLSFQIRDLLLNEIETATQWRKWQDAYIIGTYPERCDREEIQRKYGAELVHISTPQDECIKRAMQLESVSIREVVVGWINDYWQRFTE